MSPVPSFVRNAVDSLLPGFGNVYRTLRAQRESTRTPKLTPHGFKLIGPPGMIDGTFEPDEAEVIRQMIDECETFVDVGANVGLYTCVAAAAGKNVIAIEPSPDNLRLLYRNIRENEFTVEVFPVGLSDKPGIMKLFGNGTGASFVTGWAKIPESWASLAALSTLDILIGNRFSERQMFIKIDVEGLESRVLRGALETLRRARRPSWLVEICLTEHFPNGINPHFLATFETFWALGYRTTTADKTRRAVTANDVQRWVHEEQVDFGTHNYIFF